MTNEEFRQVVKGAKVYVLRHVIKNPGAKDGYKVRDYEVHQVTVAKVTFQNHRFPNGDIATFHNAYYKSGTDLMNMADSATFWSEHEAKADRVKRISEQIKKHESLIKQSQACLELLSMVHV